MSQSYNRNFDATDLIVQLQKDQNKVHFDSTTPLTIYRYVQWSSQINLHDSITISLDNRSRYDESHYDSGYFV